MKNNPVIPYILILAFGIGLIFFLSVEGVGNKEQIAAENGAATGETGGATTGGETTGGATGGAAGGETAGGATGGKVDGEAIVQSTCISCHGADLSGGMGPKLTGGAFDAAKIEDVLVNGSPVAGSPMTPGFKTAEEAKAIAEYITSIK